MMNNLFKTAHVRQCIFQWAAVILDCHNQVAHGVRVMGVNTLISSPHTYDNFSRLLDFGPMYKVGILSDSKIWCATMAPCFFDSIYVFNFLVWISFFSKASQYILLIQSSILVVIFVFPLKSVYLKLLSVTPFFLPSLSSLFQSLLRFMRNPMLPNVAGRLLTSE